MFSKYVLASKSFKLYFTSYIYLLFISVLKFVPSLLFIYLKIAVLKCFYQIKSVNNSSELL